MDALQSEYGFTNELGMVFIPNSMQEQSNFKAFNGKVKTMVDFSVEDNFIVVRYNNPTDEKNKRAIDELGRIVIPTHTRQEIRMSKHDILVIYLIDNDTIKIRTLNIKKAEEPYHYDFYHMESTDNGRE